jgi:hypothetical protein
MSIVLFASSTPPSSWIHIACLRTSSSHALTCAGYTNGPMLPNRSHVLNFLTWFPHLTALRITTPLVSAATSPLPQVTSKGPFAPGGNGPSLCFVPCPPSFGTKGLHMQVTMFRVLPATGRGSDKVQPYIRTRFYTSSQCKALPKGHWLHARISARDSRLAFSHVRPHRLCSPSADGRVARARSVAGLACDFSPLSFDVGSLLSRIVRAHAAPDALRRSHTGGQ